MGNSKKIFLSIMVLFAFAFCAVAQGSDLTTESQTVENASAENNQFDNYFQAQEVASGNIKSGSGIFTFLRMVFMLAVVCACIYGVLWFVRKTQKTEANDDQFLRQVASISVAPGKTVQIVTLIDHAYIIGVGDDSINLISEVNDKELIQAMNLYADGKKNVKKPKNFADILEIFMPNGPRDSGGVFSDSQKSFTDLLNRQRNKLNGNEEE